MHLTFNAMHYMVIPVLFDHCMLGLGDEQPGERESSPVRQATRAQYVFLQGGVSLYPHPPHPVRYATCIQCVSYREGWQGRWCRAPSSCWLPSQLVSARLCSLLERTIFRIGTGDSLSLTIRSGYTGSNVQYIYCVCMVILYI